jgi:outer membrane protein TolC
MGYPANTTLDLETEIPAVPDVTLTQTVDELINRALIDRPDLQASRSVTLQARARVKETRSRMLPTLSASGSVSRIWSGIAQGFQRTPYSLSLLLQIPVFDGFSRQFDLMQAKTAADAALERTRSAEQQTTYQVFSAHSDFLTAGQRVKTTNDLMDSARQSEEVALGRYKEGVGSILDLLSAQKSLASARAEQINSQLSWFIALAQLAHDVGILDPRGDNPLVPVTRGYSSEVKHHDNNQESK